MGLDEFRGYLGAAQWLQNRKTDSHLQVATLTSKAAFSDDPELIEHIGQISKDLRTYTNER